MTIPSKTIFFTSDHHFGHANIIRFCNRPFRDTTEVEEELVRRWNERVGPNDEVYHLGDFALGQREQAERILDRLNGTKYLILGNHDSAASNCRNKFKWIKEYHELKVPDAECPNGVRRIVLFHYAMRVWRSDFRGTWHLYGHSHNNLPEKDDSLSFDIGVDANDFYPLSYAEVKARMQRKNWQPPFGLREDNEA
jgi:calcineurin-like phosphoesterase family protein